MNSSIDWRPGFPVTWWNSWSNVAYPLVGLTALLVAPSWPTAVFALLQALLGYGSYRYHSRPSPYTQRLDWSGIFATQSFIALLNWYPTEPWIALSGLILAAILVAVFVWRDRRRQTHRDWHAGVLFLLGAIPAYLYGDRTLALVGAGLFALGYACWQLEKRAGWRDGHGWWHVLTAAGQSLLLVSGVR